MKRYAELIRKENYKKQEIKNSCDNKLAIGNFLQKFSWLFDPKANVSITLNNQLLILKWIEMILSIGCVVQSANTEQHWCYKTSLIDWNILRASYTPHSSNDCGIVKKMKIGQSAAKYPKGQKFTDYRNTTEMLNGVEYISIEMEKGG